LNGDNGSCETSYTDSIFIFDLPISSIEIPPLIQCYGLSIPFGNNSTNATNYAWDFGIINSNSDVSTQIEPTFIFPGSGNYTIQLIASSNSSCRDTTTIDVTLNEPLVISFTHNDSLCITDGSYNFDGTASGQPNATFLWNFGSNSVPSSATLLDVPGVKYLTPGVHNVMLIGSYDVCNDTVFSSVFVYSEPSIDFEYLNTLQCAPSTALFVNQSQSNAPTIYLWDFGDGGSSNYNNPSHVYLNPGSYSVGLTMITLKGCIDTLYLQKQDLVQVYKSPKAGFTVNPNKVDICNSKVEFIDQSIDAETYFYFFDSRKYTSTEANFFHEYSQSGGDYPIQVVISEFGCRDTAMQTVFVEPFTVYIPNTFIPDGNQVNDILIPKTAYEVNDWSFQIFNKWGELLFETNDFDQGWDGTYESKPCQDGTYIYVLKYRPCDSPYATQQINGFVNLIR
jgi:gliding motility-associated-like protein